MYEGVSIMEKSGEKQLDPNKMKTYDEDTLEGLK